MEQQAGFLRLIGLIIAAGLIVVGVFFYTPIGGFALSEEYETTAYTDLGDISEVRLRGSGTVQMRPGTAPTLSITSDTVLTDKFLVDNENGVLTISMNELDLVRSLKVDPELTTLTLTLPELSALHLSGSYILEEATIEGDELLVTTQGKTTGTAKVTANTLTLRTSGHNDLTLLGSAFTETTFILNGTGQVDSSDFTTPEATVNTNGSGTLRLNNPRQAALELNGATKVFFETLPTEQFSARSTGQSIIGIYDPNALNEETTPNDNEN